MTLVDMEPAGQGLDLFSQEHENSGRAKIQHDVCQICANNGHPGSKIQIEVKLVVATDFTIDLGLSI